MKTLHRFLLPFLLVFSISSQSQNLDWTVQQGGSGRDFGEAITTDKEGNIYTMGSFSGTVDFNPSNGKFNLTAKYNDYFISKFDPTGKFIWAVQLGSSVSNYQLICSIAIDKQGNILATGSFDQQSDFDPSSNALIITPSSSDVFICKLDKNGALKWVKTFGSIGYELSYSIGVDSMSNVITTGIYNGDIDMDPGSGTYILKTKNTLDVFLSKLDSMGNFLWAKNIYGPYNKYPYSLKIDRWGSILIGGEFDGSIYFDSSGVNAFSSNQTSDIFIAKFNSNGKCNWAKHIFGTSGEYCRSIAIDNNGSVFFTGFFYDKTDFNPDTGKFIITSLGSYDIFVCNLDSSGKFKWAKALGGTNDEKGYAIALDMNSNVFTSGYFTGTGDFDPSNNTFNLTSIGASDIFVSKLTSSGNFAWAKQFGGKSDEQCYALTGDKYNAVTLTGNFLNKVDFDPSKDTFYLSSLGNEDGFITKLSCASMNKMSATVCDSYLSPSKKFTWTSTGVYNDTLKNYTGCDSIINVKLSVNNTKTTISDTFCDYFTPPSKKHTWTKSGVYYDTMPNSLGCYKITTYKLTINSKTYDSLIITDCNLYVTPSKKKTYTKSGIYFDTLTNSSGCDSIIKIFLTINNKTFSNLSIRGCKTYLSPSKKYIWNNSGLFKDTILNTKGCDSIITITLLLHNESNSSQSIVACDSFISPSKNHKWFLSGTFNDTVQNQFGCDSVISFTLQIINSQKRINIDTLCYGDSLKIRNNIYFKSGKYLDTFKNHNGCDSIIITELAIKPKLQDSLILSDSSISVTEKNATFQWINCTQGIELIKGETHPRFIPKKSGEYAVIISNGKCIDTSKCIYFHSLGHPTIIFEDNFLIFPNPNNGQFEISSKENATLFLFDSINNLIFTTNLTNGISQINVEYLPGGVYSAIIKTNDTQKMIKLIIY